MTDKQISQLLNCRAEQARHAADNVATSSAQGKMAWAKAQARYGRIRAAQRAWDGLPAVVGEPKSPLAEALQHFCVAGLAEVGQWPYVDYRGESPNILYTDGIRLGILDRAQIEDPTSREDVESCVVWED